MSIKNIKPPVITKFLNKNPLPSKKEEWIFAIVKYSLKQVLENKEKEMSIKISEEFIKQNYPVQTGLNNPILRTKSKWIEEINEEILSFGKILFKAMELYDGIWLAAPQIWVNKRIIAICQLNKKEDKVIFSEVLINPEIIEKSEKMFIQEEGCLSLPGMEWDVQRHFKVKVIYTGLDGKKHQINATWLNAAILQHEIDHLDWILFWDKVVDKKAPNFKKLLNL